MAIAALIDVDGTLIDSNYQHVIAWQRAFANLGLRVPAARIHRTIGIGSDRFVEAACDARTEHEHGDALRDAHGEQYERLIDEVSPLAGARELLEALAERDVAIILASSAKADELDRYLDELGARPLVTATVSGDDVETTKPAPDVIAIARGRVDDRPALMIGDSRWDCEAAGNAGVPALGVLTGGWSSDELRGAGAVAVFDDLNELREALPGVLEHAQA